MNRRKYVRLAAEKHTNLTIFGSVISILEGGNIYGGCARTERAATKIINTCKAEMQRLLAEYDTATEAAVPSPAPETRDDTRDGGV